MNAYGRDKVRATSTSRSCLVELLYSATNHQEVGRKLGLPYVHPRSAKWRWLQDSAEHVCLNLLYGLLRDSPGKWFGVPKESGELETRKRKRGGE